MMSWRVARAVAARAQRTRLALAYAVEALVGFRSVRRVPSAWIVLVRDVFIVDDVHHEESGA